MKMDRLTPLLTAAWILGGQAFPAHAEADTCRAIDSPSERLACYDRLHGRQEAVREEVVTSEEPPPARERNEVDSSTAHDPRPTTSPSPPPQPASESFGEEQLPSPTAPAEQAELEAIVVSTGRSMTGRHWYRLEGGQLWEQVTPRHTGIDGGDAVRISRSPLGTYHIRRADGSSRSSQVRRRE